MARTDAQRIVIINGDGDNTALIQYFAQTQLDSPRITLRPIGARRAAG
jgi:hypothetical protein